MSTRPRYSLLPLVCAAAFGCTTSADEDAGALPETASQTGSFAILQVERFTPTEADGVPPRIVAGAKVARYRSIEGDALLGLLGAAARDLESCNVSVGLGELALKPEARVELLSIGQISMRAGNASSTFSPRLFPALATTASGWFYAGEAELSAPPTEFDEYVLSAPGEQGVGAFEAAVTAPSNVTGLTLSGASLERGAALDRTRDAEITWEAEDPRGRVELELYAGGSVLSCAARDDGRFSLSIGRLAGMEADENASFVVRRVRVVPIDMHGVDSAYARVASTQTFTLQVR